MSSQLRKELQALFFGSSELGEQQGQVPESLIHWLSQRYVSTSDLQAALASLELSILRNISLQLELSQVQTLGEAESRTKNIVQTVTGTVRHASAAEGLTEEVHMPLGSYSLGFMSTSIFFIILFCVLHPACEADGPECSEAVLSGPNWPGGLRPGVWR